MLACNAKMVPLFIMSLDVMGRFFFMPSFRGKAFSTSIQTLFLLNKMLRTCGAYSLDYWSTREVVSYQSLILMASRVLIDKEIWSLYSKFTQFLSFCVTYEGAQVRNGFLVSMYKFSHIFSEDVLLLRICMFFICVLLIYENYDNISWNSMNFRRRLISMWCRSLSKIFMIFHKNFMLISILLHDFCE